jgi:hypothetical protein
MLSIADTFEGEDFTQTVTYEDPETGEIMNYEVDLLKHEWA